MVKWISIVVAVLFGLAALSVVSSGLGLFTKTFDTDNVISKYEQFHDRCAAIQRFEQSLRSQRALLETAESAEERERVRANVAGLEAQRQGAISRYNANATKTNVGIFQGRTLPQTLNPDTPTICGEY